MLSGRLPFSSHRPNEQGLVFYLGLSPGSRRSAEASDRWHFTYGFSFLCLGTALPPSAPCSVARECSYLPFLVSRGHF